MSSTKIDFSLIENLTNSLLEAQNSDGGWGAEKGKQSNTEATVFALLGLHLRKEAFLAERINHGLAWLTARQNVDGSWPLSAQLPEGSWATALAILSLARFTAHRRSALRGTDWLLRHRGARLGWFHLLLYHVAPHKLPMQLNPNLQGWSWTSGAFSWVEPTAYALIALKTLRPSLPSRQAEDRIRQGERMLYDRMCEGGGWNYGNVRVLGERLWPYPDTTALALIALQDHQTKAANQLSLQALQNMLTHVESGLTLSWSMLCFSLYGRDVTAWNKALVRSYERTGFLGETKTLALALLALGDGAEVFRG